MSDSETRLIDRRCRCGKLATEIHRACVWHDATSAEAARDLQAAYLTLVAEREPKVDQQASGPLRRRVWCVLTGGHKTARVEGLRYGALVTCGRCGWRRARW